METCPACGMNGVRTTDKLFGGLRARKSEITCVKCGAHLKAELDAVSALAVALPIALTAGVVLWTMSPIYRMVALPAGIAVAAYAKLKLTKLVFRELKARASG